MARRRRKLCDIIREAREDAGLSQTMLARELGLSQSTVSGWELDETSPSLYELEQLAKRFRVDLYTVLIPASLDYAHRFRQGKTRRRDKATTS